MACIKYTLETTSTVATFQYQDCGTSLYETIEILEGIACNVPTAFAGSQAYPSTQPYNLGSAVGSTRFEFNPIGVPDRFMIYYGEPQVVVFDTGYRGHSDYDIVGETPHREAFTTALSGLTDPLTGKIYGSSDPPDGMKSDGYPPVISSSGNNAIYWDKNDSTKPLVIVKVYAPISGTHWDCKMYCPNGDSTPVGGSPAITVCSLSTPTVSPVGAGTITNLGTICKEYYKSQI
jgi:hypothetical protein